MHAVTPSLAQPLFDYSNVVLIHQHVGDISLTGYHCLDSSPHHNGTHWFSYTEESRLIHFPES